MSEQSELAEAAVKFANGEISLSDLIKAAGKASEVAEAVFGASGWIDIDVYEGLDLEWTITLQGRGDGAGRVTKEPGGEVKEFSLFQEAENAFQEYKGQYNEALRRRNIEKYG